MRALGILAAVTLVAARALASERLPMEQLAQGSDAARAVDGARIAAQWCDSCHMVEQRGTGAAPPFAVIALRRSPDQVRAFLARPHGAMPPIGLSNEQISDIIAYMRSLVPPR